MPGLASCDVPPLLPACPASPPCPALPCPALQFGFFVDLASSMAWMAQLALTIAYHILPNANPRTAMIVMESVRCGGGWGGCFKLPIPYAH